ncbi:MAG TPA: DUF6510 family protein [Candidatus Limnocylindria bacterium]|jgi:hypothetical protein|nr:DUF6510 family protein [Candidatus Limnocylindria bacterium]
MTEPLVDELVLDGNAVAGVLIELFGSEMTIATGVCDHCGNAGAVGSLHAWIRGPGIVLRCVACGGVMVRIAQTPRGTFVDLRGTRRMRLPQALG